MTIRKAVMPVAGFGTRFLPVTRAVPKNLLPVFDRPSIHLCVEEAVEAGIEDIIFVVSEGQRDPIARYFSPQPALEEALASRNNTAMLDQMLEISGMANVVFVTQTEQRGLGHAVLTAREVVGDEAFAVFLPDDVIWADSPTIGEMIEVHRKTGGNVVALEEVADEDIPSKGIVAVERMSETLSRITWNGGEAMLWKMRRRIWPSWAGTFWAPIYSTLSRIPRRALWTRYSLQTRLRGT